MAAGDRKLKVREVVIARGNPVIYVSNWSFYIENKVGADVFAFGGQTTGSFGTPAAWRALTGLQMENQVNADIVADIKTPARDSLS